MREKILQLPGISIEETNELLPPKCLIVGIVGSTSHGTKLQKDDPCCIDDEDILGVCVGPEDHYFGLGRFEQKEIKKDKWDCVTYEVRKFFRLLLQQNPNVLALLYLQEKDYIYISDSGKLLLENKNLFVSKQAFHAFSGYAHQQMHKMTHGACEGYMGAKRKALVEKFGFDCKNAAHLIRLLRMGIEYLGDGVLRVFREDACELKDIKSGKWELERVQKEADRLFTLAQEAFVRSTLPAFPDKAKAEQLLIDILKKELICGK